MVIPTHSSDEKLLSRKNRKMNRSQLSSQVRAFQNGHVALQTELSTRLKLST